MHRIKVVHLVAGELDGGAARGAYWLHKGLIELGVDSHVITNSKTDLGDTNVTLLPDSSVVRFVSKIIRRLDSWIIKMYPRNKEQIYSTGFAGLNYKKNKHYKRANIVHLHWINSLVSTNSLKSINKPVIWTFRDMWPFTGGCHYSISCDKYKTGCGSCPQLGSKKDNDLSRLILKNKAIAYRGITVVGISPWLSKEISESLLFRNQPVNTIFNNIDCSAFSPIEKQRARNILKIETTKKIVLAGAINTSDPYKGFQLFLEALESLDPNMYYICVFGKSIPHLFKHLDFEVNFLGYLSSSYEMQLAYSCADVFVAPSVQEAFGKTIVESMSCGTPVVCFDATGPGDIIEHKIDGYKAEPFGAKGIAEGIEWTTQTDNFVKLSARARESALSKYDLKIIAKKYLELYQKNI